MAADLQAVVSLLLCGRGPVGPSRITMAFGVSGSGSQGSVVPKALGVLDSHWCRDWSSGLASRRPDLQQASKRCVLTPAVFLSDMAHAPQESPGTSQREEKALSPDLGAARPPTPGRLSGRGADSSLASAGSRGRQGRGASARLPGRDKSHESDPATTATSLVGPGGDQPAMSSKRDAPQDPAAAGEASRKEEAATEPEEEAPVGESGSDASDVSLSHRRPGQPWLLPCPGLSWRQELPPQQACGGRGHQPEAFVVVNRPTQWAVTS